MRVLLGAFGTRGDVQPLLVLGKALVGAGHTVTLAVPPNSVELARSFGLEALGFGLDYEEVSRRGASGSFWEFLSVLPLIRGELAVQLHHLERKAAEVDVIAGSSVFAVGSILSERYSKPYAFVGLCPQLFPSGDHPSPSVPVHPLPRWVNHLSWWAFSWMWTLVLRKPLTRARKERGLSPMRSPWRELMGRTPLLACDPLLGPAPGDYPVPLAQVGALWPEESAELSAPVQAFLNAGAPPVYVGFGSMSDLNPGRTTRGLLESIRRTGVRAIISRGWAGLEAEAPPEEVLFVGPEPHGKLFARCSAIVHHGGAGTTHAAARAGVPQVIMPQLLDQHYWAYRIERLGLGPRRVPRYPKDPGLLVRALHSCLNEPELRRRAREVGAALVQDGTTQAVQFLERLAERGPPPA